MIIQSDFFAAIATVTICPLTTTSPAAPLARIPVEPTDSLPLAQPSWIMADKITTVRRNYVGEVIGQLPAEAMVRLDRSLMVFLGLA